MAVGRERADATPICTVQRAPGTIEFTYIKSVELHVRLYNLCDVIYIYVNCRMPGLMNA